MKIPCSVSIVFCQISRKYLSVFSGKFTENISVFFLANLQKISQYIYIQCFLANIFAIFLKQQGNSYFLVELFKTTFVSLKNRPFLMWLIFLNSLCQTNIFCLLLEWLKVHVMADYIRIWVPKLLTLGNNNFLFHERFYYACIDFEVWNVQFFSRNKVSQKSS